MTKQFKKMKFKTYGDLKLGRRLQNILFDLGYTWCTVGKRVSYTEHKYLYSEPDGQIMFGDYDGVFEEDSAEEVDIEWLCVVPQETVELGGKTYLKSELEVALENINPIGSR